MSKFFDDTMQGLLEAIAWNYMNPPEEKKEEVKLKRCPFCGGEANVKEDKNHISYVHCKNGCCQTPYFQNPKTAIEIWNTRKPAEDVLDRLKEMFKHHKATKTVQRLVLETVENEL